MLHGDMWHSDGHHRTTHEWVRDNLRRAIVAGALAPGERLVQTDLAERMGVSVTPLREALRDLVGEGLVRLDPHRGATVREVDVDEAREVYELRLVLEPMAARLAAERATEEEIAAAERLQAAMDAETDPQRGLQLNQDFHLLLIDAARSPQLAGILRGLRAVSAIHLAAAAREGGYQVGTRNRDHHEILAALRRRDAEAAGRLMADHLTPTWQSPAAAQPVAAALQP